MDPIAFVVRLGSVERPVGTYGIALALACLVGGGLFTRAAARDRQDTALVIAWSALTVGGGLASAYLGFWAVEVARTGVWFDPSRGGLMFFAGLGGGLLVGVQSGRAFGLPVARLLDVGVHALPAGHAIGRIGCFFGGCCYGGPCDPALAWASIGSDGVARHPTALYEATVLLALATLFAVVPPRRVGRGRRFGAYLACYAAARVALEVVRGDVVRGVWSGGVSTAQVIGGGWLLGSLAWLATTHVQRAAVTRHE